MLEDAFGHCGQHDHLDALVARSEETALARPARW
jgi:hypothetical protein